ncbi:unnamed protein product [Angiostrongylus costaricensis]|uniref:DUF659 domain-containing protein n=1 Tax=Angiostrongylus costaricensis TaxID=334426 RepID=A0A158PEP2_ANGCS|nr:unnamed protein product [Angiostrongylus costaricensis]
MTVSHESVGHNKAQTTTVIPTEDYLKSLNIPPIRFDFNEDQLRIHVICTMLCCPRQMDNGGNINGESVDRNIREIFGGCLDSKTIGWAVTNNDAVEAEKFAKNPVRLFQHPKFANIVKMDESCLKFRPVLPDALKFLCGRIHRGVQCNRARKITKGLSEAVFYGIDYDNSSSLLMVGINENARPYSEKELMTAAKACEASTSIPAPLSDVTSLYQNTSRSPLFNVMSGGRKLNKRRKWEKNNSEEPSHVALFSSEDDCDSENGSEEPRNLTGVYTTDEENDLVCVHYFDMELMSFLLSGIS